MDTRRFLDPSTRLYALAADDIEVVCPRCAARALVVPQRVDGTSVLSWPRRLICTSCASTASWSPRGQASHWGAPVDPFFQLPLWLQADCCGRTLWAFNEAHLTLLHDYVAAHLRERARADPGLTLVARLPRWVKAAKHRDEVLRTITRLRQSREPARTSVQRP
ncbi:hypothetical protein GCM10010168_77340 [Actinoplanes ianthinogenes]|uniref:TFIIB-type zinc ribbon-containing protein n=1 Tax=Actinoplanes ianthinogenes TaxID=122358 RepID=A0ABN6CSW0_9ACTN|nr:TFIIB-type zinc ribbon-containing protein [Actinoplanes ianthinogenes]BCJ48340.1 hypothetical protein Aiant_89970 [Actinoplanes ianthinogenes]GGR47035.1 hypothetical protein GCM10010168_77340 [Actinoplanes ianthinogenes]